MPTHIPLVFGYWVFQNHSGMHAFQVARMYIENQSTFVATERIRAMKKKIGNICAQAPPQKTTSNVAAHLKKYL
jgi:hypothetical protein